MRVVCKESPSQWVVGGDRSGGTIKHVQLQIPKGIINCATIPIMLRHWTHINTFENLYESIEKIN